MLDIKGTDGNLIVANIAIGASSFDTGPPLTLSTEERGKKGEKREIKGRKTLCRV